MANRKKAGRSVRKPIPTQQALAVEGQWPVGQHEGHEVMQILLDIASRLQAKEDYITA